MAYEKDADFYADYKSVMGGPPIGQRDQDTMLRAWTVYTNHRHAAPLGMQVFGRHNKFRTGRMVSNSVQPGITLAEMKNFRAPGAPDNTRLATDEKMIANSLQGGSILRIIPDQWTPQINDSWLCGGVHSLQPFHSASILNDENVFSTDEHIVTVTGRELVGLALAGYKRHNTQFEPIFARTITTKCDDLTLVMYKAKLDELFGGTGSRQDKKTRGHRFLRTNGMIEF